MSELLTYKCPNCGANIKFDPAKQEGFCSYCEASFSIEELNNFQALLSKPQEEKTENFKTEYNSYTCDSCGGEIIADDTTVATFCPFCHNSTIVARKISGEFKPDYIIPFATDKSVAQENFKQFIKGKPLAPKEFRKIKRFEEIKGLYVPFWLYDATADYHLEFTTAKRIHSTDKTTVKYYKSIREGTNHYKKVAVDGSSHINDDDMNAVHPYFMQELKEFNPSYLSGFLAEKYNQTGEQCQSDALDKITAVTKDVVANDLQKEGFENIKENKTATKMNIDVTGRKYALLPIWFLSVKSNGESYPFIMNGQTGKFIGNVPVDKKRTILYFAGITGIVTSILSFIIWIAGQGGVA